MTKVKTKSPASKYPLIAFRLSADLAKQIAVTAKEDGVSKSSVIKTAIETYLKKRSQLVLGLGTLSPREHLPANKS